MFVCRLLALARLILPRWFVRLARIIIIVLLVRVMRSQKVTRVRRTNNSPAEMNHIGHRLGAAREELLALFVAGRTAANNRPVCEYVSVQARISPLRLGARKSARNEAMRDDHREVV